MFTHGAGDLLHRLDLGAHDLPTPLLQKLSGPGGRVVIPKLLKGFLKKVSPDGLQVVAEQVAQPKALFDLQILLALQQQPARFLQQRRHAFPRHAAGFAGADLIQSLVHFRHDVEAVEDVKRLGAFLADDLQVWFPHVGTDEGDL